MKVRARLSIAAIVVCGALATAGIALAAASTTVTIKSLDPAQGFIFSSSKSCLGGRTVILFQQLGSTQNPSVDTKRASTTSSREGSKGFWDMGNPGEPHHKKYYVLARKKTGCKAARSKTVFFK